MLSVTAAAPQLPIFIPIHEGETSMNWLRNIERYVLARLQERSTVAGIVGVVMAATGLALPAGADSVIINAIVGVAGLVAMVVPGGK